MFCIIQNNVNNFKKYLMVSLLACPLYATQPFNIKFISENRKYVIYTTTTLPTDFLIS